MNIKNHARAVRTVALALLMTIGPQVSHADPAFDGIYVFGDSLSDSGNAYALTGNTSKAPYSAIPSAPYAIGGHHFSNGKTWVEWLAQHLNSATGGKAAYDKPGVNGNYAFGGARARTFGNSPTSTDQVNMYLDDFGSASANALYILQFGGNDIRDALFDSGNAGAILVSAVAAQINNIQSLYGKGARHFAIANAPNLARAPAVIAYGPLAVAGADMLSQQHNLILEYGVAAISLPGLHQLEAMMPGAKFYRIDFFGLTNDLAIQPWNYGISDPVTPCLIFDTKDDAKCDNPEEHAFWDGIHPTSVVHRILADIAATAVAAD